jgi:hypothetical protein
MGAFVGVGGRGAHVGFWLTSVMDSSPGNLAFLHGKLIDITGTC